MRWPKDKRIMGNATLAVWVDPQNLDHHLWNNNGTWWCHLTLHQPDYTKRRLRRSLGTRCLKEARDIRDFLLATLPGAEEVLP